MILFIFLDGLQRLNSNQHLQDAHFHVLMSQHLRLHLILQSDTIQNIQQFRICRKSNKKSTQSHITLLIYFSNNFNSIDLDHGH